MRSFRELTGWSLEMAQRGEIDFAAAHSAPVPGSEQRLVLRAPNENSSPPAHNAKAAQELTSALAQLLGQQHKNHAVGSTAATPAPTAPPARVRSEQQLDKVLSAVLRSGAVTLKCAAAAIYLLDEETTELSLRQEWGLKPQGARGPRPLATSLADLEALAGHAVALEDASLLPHWRIPESYPAGICVPISSASEILGTLWIFSDDVRDFNDRQTGFAEIIAGRIAAELEREAAVAASDHRSSDRAHKEVTAWLRDQLPNVPPTLDGWRLSASVHQKSISPGTFYDWFLPSTGAKAGALALGVGNMHGSGVAVGLSTIAARAALRAHGESLEEPWRVMEAVNETLWSTSNQTPRGSLAYALLDSQTGRLSLSAAGNAAAIITDDAGVEVVACRQAPLGGEPDAVFPRERRILQRGQSLILFADLADSLLDDPRWLKKLRGLSPFPADQLAQILAEQIREITPPAGHETKIIVLQRR